MCTCPKAHRPLQPRCGSSIVETASVWGDPVIERDHETARFGDEVTGMLGSALVQEDLDSWDNSAVRIVFQASSHELTD